MKSTFSERLISLRKRNNLTQKQAAKGIGMSEIGVQNYEANRRKPTFDSLIQIADYFNVSMDYLAGRTDNPQRL